MDESNIAAVQFKIELLYFFLPV